MGGPGENQDTVEETLEFIHRETGPRDVALVIYGIRVYPNTGMETGGGRANTTKGKSFLAGLFICLPV